MTESVHANNSWFVNNSARSVVVLVHGIFSDSHRCWRAKSQEGSVYWPDLIRGDVRLGQPDIFLAGYYTKLDAGPSEIQHCAAEVFRALSLPDSELQDSPISRKRIIFVCHSTGGIVVRQLLNQHAQVFRDIEVGLLLLASPSGGSVWASRLSFFSRLYGYRLAQQLSWGSWSLSHIDDGFRSLLDQNLIPRLRGIEAFENRFILTHKWLPNFSFVVDKDSACKYFGPARLLPGTDHFTAAKPDTVNHPAHQLLLELTVKMNHDFSDQPNVIPSKTDSPSGPPPTEGEELDHWGDFMEKTMSEGAFFHEDPWRVGTKEQIDFKKRLKTAIENSMRLLNEEKYTEVLLNWEPVLEDPLFDVDYEEWHNRPFFQSKIHEGLGCLFVSHAQLAAEGQNHCENAVKFLMRYLRGNPYSMQKADSTHLGPEEGGLLNENYKTMLTLAREWLKAWGVVAFLWKVAPDTLPPSQRLSYFKDEVDMLETKVINRLNEVEFILQRHKKRQTAI